MTLIVIAIIVGAVAHGVVSHLTRTPEEDQTLLRWKLWHTAVTGVISSILIMIPAVLLWMATGWFTPTWVLLVALDVISTGWRLHQHRARTGERKALQALFERPSFGEGSR